MKKYAFDVSVVLKRSVSVEHWLHNYCWNFFLLQQMQELRHKLHRWWWSMISMASSAADVVDCNSFHAATATASCRSWWCFRWEVKNEPKSKKLRVTITLNSAPLTYVETILKIEVRRMSISLASAPPLLDVVKTTLTCFGPTTLLSKFSHSYTAAGVVTLLF